MGINRALWFLCYGRATCATDIVNWQPDQPLLRDAVRNTTLRLSQHLDKAPSSFLQSEIPWLVLLKSPASVPSSPRTRKFSLIVNTIVISHILVSVQFTSSFVSPAC